MKKIIIRAIFFCSISTAVASDLSSEQISAKIDLIESLSLNCIAVLREKGLPDVGNVWVSCDRYEKRLPEFEQIMSKDPRLSKENEKKVKNIRFRKPLIEEFSKY